MDIPPEWREGIAKEGPAVIGGLVGALLVAKGFFARCGYLVVGYLLGRFAGPALSSSTGFGADIAMILAGALGLSVFERTIEFLRSIDSKQIGASVTQRLKELIGKGGADRDR